LLPDSLKITSHCLLRLCTALALEAEGLAHGFPLATLELNQQSGRDFTAKQWLQILEPFYVQRFSPNDPSFRLV